MLTEAPIRGFGVLTLLLTALLTTSAATQAPEVPLYERTVPLRADDISSIYLTPDGYVPAATGILNPSTQSTSESDSWVALRSPTSTKVRKELSRSVRSPRRNNRWRGRNTRGRPLSELKLKVEDYGISDWVYPIDEQHIAGSPVGLRRDPITKKPRHHYGQDIGCRSGTPIYAVADGSVKHSRNSTTAGRYVEIEHLLSTGQRLRTRYLHMSRRLVTRGEKVRRGQQIGRCGNTGASTSPHLHFGVWLEEKPQHPFSVFPQIISAEEGEKRAWDEAIEAAVEAGTLDDLLASDSLPREVSRLILDWRRRGSKHLPRKLSQSTPELELEAVVKIAERSAADVQSDEQLVSAELESRGLASGGEDGSERSAPTPRLVDEQDPTLGQSIQESDSLPSLVEGVEAPEDTETSDESVEAMDDVETSQGPEALRGLTEDVDEASITEGVGEGSTTEGIDEASITEGMDEAPISESSDEPGVESN